MWLADEVGALADLFVSFLLVLFLLSVLRNDKISEVLPACFYLPTGEAPSL